MRLTWIGIVLTCLAAPAMAIGKGECCADVNGVCISRCNKTSCTGNGDCDLALTSAPAGTDPSTPAVRRSFRTLSRRDQGRLERIFAAADSGGATAIGKGECCAKVHNVCISSCQRSSCTGNGDCKLVESAAPSGSSSSPAIRRALKTMNRRDQATLKKGLTAEKDPTGSGGRPDTDPIHVYGEGQVGGLQTPPSGTGVPKMQQTGGTTAKVPMKHGSCGLDCGTHVLATQGGNLNVSFKIGMSCPSGQGVSFVAYKLKGQSQVKIVQSNTGSSSYTKNVKAQPFSKDELEEACRAALGGGWAEPGRHKNQTKTVKKTIEETVEVWGKCSGWTNTVKRSYPAALTLTCEDQSWSLPVP